MPSLGEDHDSCRRQGPTIAWNNAGNLLIVQAGSDEFEFWDHETGESMAVDIDWS